MNAQQTMAIIEKVGKNVILSTHQFFEEVGVDNSEHIPALRRSIEAVGLTADELASPDMGSALRTELRQFAHQLFVNLWLKLAEEDEEDPDLPAERKRAKKTFNEIFDNL